MEQFDYLIHQLAQNPKNVNDRSIEFIENVEIDEPLKLQKLTFLIKSLLNLTLDGKTNVSIDRIIQLTYSQPELHKIFYEIDLNSILNKSLEEETHKIIHLFKSVKANS